MGGCVPGRVIPVSYQLVFLWLPPAGVWRFRVGAKTDWPRVSVLGLGEMASLILNFYLSVAARIPVKQIRS